MMEIDALQLYNLPLHEYTMPVVHCAQSSMCIPTALMLSGELSEQLAQIQAFVMDYFEYRCFDRGIVLYDDDGNSSGLQPLVNAIQDDPELRKFHEIYVLIGGLDAFEREFPGLCGAYLARDPSVFYAFPSRVRTNVFLSGSASAEEFILQDLQIGAVLNAGAQGTSLKAESLGRGNYLYLDFEDDPGVVLEPYIAQAIEFIQAATGAGKRVLVHCQQGQSRSASLVVAYLMATEQLGFNAALEVVKLARPMAQPNFSFIRQLKQFESNITSHLPEPE
jgi:hypothetical protein